MSDFYVFVHGLGLSNTIWEPINKFVVGARITPNIPGHGIAAYDCYEFDAMWEYIESHLSPKQWRSTILVLHSMSAAFLPELVKSRTRPAGLVLIEGNLVSADAKWSRQISMQSEDVFKDWIARVRRSAVMVLRSQLKTQHELVDVARWAEGFELVNARALREIAVNLVARSESGAILQALEKLDLPRCYLRGEWSDAWEDGRTLLANLGIPIVDIPNAGHYPMIDNPRATWDAISFHS